MEINLRKELQYLIDNDVIKSGEYQLTDALENMKTNGVKFAPGQVDEWLDCGNKNATVHTNQRILEHIKDSETLVAANSNATNSVIIPPCYIGEGVTLENTVVGPHVSIADGTTIKNSVIDNSIVYANTEISNGNFSNSMIGNHVKYNGSRTDASIGDYTTIS